MKKFKIIIIIVSSLLLLWITAGYISARYLTRRHSLIIKSSLVLHKESIDLISEDNIKISAWFIPNKSDKVVILLPGIGSERHASIGRAKFYYDNSYNVLLPDLRGTGKSEGEVISFGWHESKDLKACYEYLKKKGFTKIAAHGCSLGAATVVYSLKDIKDYHFIVLESCYDNLDHAFANRTHKFHLPEFCYNPIRFFVEKRIDTKIENLQPIEFIKHAQCPTFIMAGDSEDQIKIEETNCLYNNCSTKEKEIYIFKGGKHEDFESKFKKEYNGILGDFISKY